MAEEAFRAFVAVEIPEEVRARCAALIRRLRAEAPGVTWTRPENLHLTLKFLGPTRPAQAERLIASLAHKAAKLSPFEVSLSGLGAFPSRRRPRVLWVGVDEGDEALRALAAKTDGAAAKAGFSREARPFSPHLTLGRVKMGRSRRTRRAGSPPDGPAGSGPEDWQALLGRADPGPLGRFPVDALVLMQSRLEPGGAVHTPLRRVPLGRGRPDPDAGPGPAGIS